jgi:hypothetical protein
MPFKYINAPFPLGGAADNANLQELVEEGGASIYRIGGNGYDESGTAIGLNSLTNDYIAAMEAIRAENNDAAFIIQIPYEAGMLDTNKMSPSKAFTMVDNIFNHFGASEHFYYAIGNEWDRYVDPGLGRKYYASEIATKIKAYAIQMKKADPEIRIVAPAVSYYAVKDYNDTDHILSKLLSSGTADITGQISSTGTGADGKYYVDVIDYHTYPGGDNGDMNNNNAPIDSANFYTYRNDLIDHPGTTLANELSTSTGKLRALLDAANVSRSASPLTFAITEMNICWLSPYLSSPSASSKYENTARGIGPRSFFAGQYWADVFSQTLKSGTVNGSAKVEFVTPWSIHEHGGDGLTDDSTGTDLGMTKDTATSSQLPVPLSTYYHYELMANNFTGRYCAGSSTKTDLKAFGSQLCNKIAIMVLNQNQNQPSTFCMRLSSSTFTPHAPYDGINVDCAIDKFYYDTIGVQSSLMLIFDGCGRLTNRYRYNISDAVADDPYSLENLSPAYRYCPNCNQTRMVCTIPDEPEIDTIEVSSNLTLDTAQVISDVIRVNNGAVLTIDSTQLVFLPGTYIDVRPGGKLYSSKSWLHGCDGVWWDGIRILGNRDTVQQVIINESVIEDAEYLINASGTARISISQSYLRNADIAVRMEDCSGFFITDNDVTGVINGIETESCTTAPSQVNYNYFGNLAKGIEMTLDDHDQLDILCNTFDNYSLYGVHSSNCELKDQGTATNGAGNVFYPNSTQVNHQFLHRGNIMRYYAGPSDTISLVTDSIKNAAVYEATNDGCQEERRPVIASQQMQLVKNSVVLRNIPNPATASTTIVFSTNLTASKAEIMIQNMYGSVIGRYPADLSVGTKEIDCHQWASGIYFYALLLDGKTEGTGKMIINR